MLAISALNPYLLLTNSHIYATILTMRQGAGTLFSDAHLEMTH